MSGAFERTYLRNTALALTGLKLWFVAAQPLVAIAGAGHDDRLFVELADRILRGEWLGEYSQFTLMKGAGYPLFIAASHLAGLPLPLAEHALYLAACWLLVRALRPAFSHDAWGLLLFAGLAWQPMSYTMPDFMGGSVLRQNLYTPLSMLIFAGLAALHTRRTAHPGRRAAWALILGISFGWFWLTREESLWIGGSIVLLLAAALAASTGLRQLGHAIWPAVLATCAALAPIAAVSALNAIHYGWFGTCEFRSREFLDAYTSLTRIQLGTPPNRVPVTRAMRLAAYEVSPTFAELRPLLEGEIGARWTGGCGTCEINGGMWMWALRDAVAEARRPRSAAEALAFYRAMAEEIHRACDEGRLPSGPRARSYMPAWQAQYTADLKVTAAQYGRFFLRFEKFNARPPQTLGRPELMILFRDLSRWRFSTNPEAPEPILPRTKAHDAWRIGALHDIGSIVRIVFVAAEILGLLAYFFVLARAAIARRWPGYLWWFATAAACGAFCVYLISLIVHVTSWPDWRPLRFAQGYPLLVLFSACAIIELAQGWWRPLQIRSHATGVSPDSDTFASADDPTRSEHPRA